MSAQPGVKKNTDSTPKALIEAKTFGEGMKAFFKGQRYVWLAHRELLKYCVFPMVLGVVVFIGLGILFVTGIDDILQFLWAKPEHWAWQILWYGVAGVAMALSAVTAVFFAYLLFMLICAPFNDLLSEKVEAIEGTLKAEPFTWSFFFRDAGQTIVLEMAKMMKKILWMGIFYIISLVVPVFGQILYIVVGTFKMSFWLGMDYVDWFLARRGYSARDRLAFGKTHSSALRGFGLMMVLVSLIPFGAILFWPGAVAGGTLLCTGISSRNSSDNDTTR